MKYDILSLERNVILNIEGLLSPVTQISNDRFFLISDEKHLVSDSHEVLFILLRF